MGSRDLVQRAIEAFRRGALSLEEVVEAALERGDSFESWLEETLVSGSEAPRQPSPERFKNYSDKLAVASVEQARERFSELPGVRSIHWGLRQVGNRPVTEPGVVIVVDRKLPADELKGSERILRRLDVALPGETRRVRIDVQAAGEPGELHLGQMAFPGNRGVVTVGVGDSRGTLGAVLETTSGALQAVLSGHVAIAEHQQVRATSATGAEIALGTVRKVVLSELGDVAWAGPVEPKAKDLLVSPAAAVRDPTSNDLTFEVAVHTARDFKPQRSWIHDIRATGHFRLHGRDYVIPNLTTADPQVTQRGDSGAPVLDFQGDLIGFVVGAWRGKTYFMPARRAIDALR